MKNGRQITCARTKIVLKSTRKSDHFCGLDYKLPKSFNFLSGFIGFGNVNDH